MKKILTFLFAVFVCLAMAVPSFATNYDYSATVYKRTDESATERAGGLTEITDSVQFIVLTINTDTYATITQSRSSTSLTNPVTAASFESATVCNDRIKFRSTASSHDLIVTHEDGCFTTIVEGFTPYDHKIIIDERSSFEHHCIAPFAFLATSVEVDTLCDFIPDTAVKDVWVEVTVLDAGETIDVGTDTDPNGFRAAVSVAATGYIKDTAIPTAGTTCDYIPATTYGVLLVTALTGDGSTTAQNGGITYIGPYFSVEAIDNAAAELTYTPSTSDTMKGLLHVFHKKVR